MGFFYRLRRRGIRSEGWVKVGIGDSKNRS